MIEDKKCIKGIIGGKVIKEVTDIADLYDENYFSGYILENKNQKRISSKRLDWVKGFVSGGRLLDIGCGTGLFLKIAQDEGFDVYGVDISSYAVERARIYCKNVSVSNLDNEELPYEKNFFDVVTMFDVFEHLRDPYSALGKVERIMGGGGHLFIETQNFNSISRRIYGKRWYGFSPGYHLTPAVIPRRLRQSLERNNFEVIGLYTRIQPSFMVPAIIKGFPKPVRLIIKWAWFTLAIINNIVLHKLAFRGPIVVLGDYMFCVAQKPK